MRQYAEGDGLLLFSLMAHLSDLPDEILVEVFKYLHHRDLCRLSRVCRRWHRLSRTPCLWRSVNLYPYILKPPDLWKLMRAFFTQSLQHLTLRGAVRKNSNKAAYAKQTISKFFITALGNRCPRVVSMTIIEGYIHNRTFAFQISDFPPTIERLAFRSTVFGDSNGWFNARTKRIGTLEHLRHLDISGCSFMSTTIGEIAYLFPKLESLSMQGSFRVTNNTLHKLVDLLSNLRVLDIRETYADGQTMMHISGHCKQLRELYVSSHKLDNEGLVKLSGKSLPNLKVLDIGGCLISDCGVQMLLQGGFKLQKLILRSINISEECVILLRETYPEIEVLVRAKSTILTS